MKPSRVSGAQWMLASAFLSAVMGACVRGIRDDVDWRVIAFARTSVGLVFSLAIVRLGAIPLPWPAPRELWVRSGCAGVAVLCTFYSATRIPVADATVLVNTSPIWLALASSVWLGRSHPRATWMALLLGTMGIVLITQPHFERRNLGGLAAATTGLLGAISLMAIGRMRQVHTAAIVAYASGAAVISSTAVLALSAPELDFSGLRNPAVVFGLVAVGAFGTLLQLTLTRAYATDDAARLGPIQYASVAFSAVFDALLFRDPPRTASLVGMLLVVAPSIWMLSRPRAPRHVESGVLPGSTELVREHLATIADAIQIAERHSSCEFRVHVEGHCQEATDRARRVFEDLAMERTKRGNAVLVYLAIDSRSIAIVFDRGISDVVPTKVLARTRRTLQSAIASEGFMDGMTTGLIEVSRDLAQWFPSQPDDANELEDSVSFAW